MNHPNLRSPQEMELAFILFQLGAPRKEIARRIGKSVTTVALILHGREDGHGYSINTVRRRMNIHPPIFQSPLPKIGRWDRHPDWDGKEKARALSRCPLAMELLRQLADGEV